MTSRMRALPARDTWSDLASSASEVAALVARSWSENVDRSIDYTPGFLDWCLACPGMSASLAPALYRDGALSAFVAAFPRRALVRGTEAKLGLVTLFTVAPECKRQGIGTALWAECITRLREQGFDGAFHWCVDGNGSNRVTCDGATLAGTTARMVTRAHWSMRFLRRGDGAPAATHVPVSPGLLLECSTKVTTAATLRRAWSQQEARWYCGRSDLVAAQYPAETPRGCLLGYAAPVAGASGEKVVVIEEVLWDALDGGERVDLLRDFLGTAARHASAVVVPHLGYADMTAFAAAGFRRSPRMVNGYLTLWNGAEPMDASSAVYVDVF